MKDYDARDENLIRRLRHIQPVTPSPEARERILRAARAEWSGTEREPDALVVPWWEAWQPLFGAVAAVILLLFGVQRMNNALSERWDAQPAAATVAAGSPTLQQLVARAGPGPDEIAAAWQRHQRQLHEVFAPPTQRAAKAVPLSKFNRSNREVGV